MMQLSDNYWSWSRTVPQLLAIVVLIGLVWPLFGSEEKHLASVVGAGVYLLYAQFSKMFIASAHRRGLQLLAAKNYQPAIREFEKSHMFFTRYPQIDHFRAVVLMSPSIWSYREMALLNVAFCYGQLGEVNMAKTTYEQVRSDFPDNDYAIHALKCIENPQAEREV